MFREKWIKTIAWCVAVAGSIMIIAPFLWVLSTSLKPAAEIHQWPPSFFPQKPTLENFNQILIKEDFPRYLLNSLLVSLGSMFSILVTSSLAGFIFAKYRFPLKGFLFSLVLATSIIPLQVYMIPIFIMVFRLGLLNSYAGLIFPMTIMTFGVFFMRQTILAIPDSLLESARIDGANEFWIYLRIVLQLSRSGLMALGIFAFSEAWANFIWPLVVVASKDMYTTELGLAVYQRQFYIEYGPITAGAVVTILPMLIVFLILRKRIVFGTVMTGMKD
jgi:multiple sugar transport system permease protein